MCATMLGRLDRLQLSLLVPSLIEVCLVTLAIRMCTLPLMILGLTRPHRLVEIPRVSVRRLVPRVKVEILVHVRRALGVTPVTLVTVRETWIALCR